MKRVEWYPLSATTMFSSAVRDTDVNYFVVRDSQGGMVDNYHSPFYVAIDMVADQVIGQKCFPTSRAGCRDFYTLLARWLQQPITLEKWRFDYVSGERELLASIVFEPT